MKKAIIPLIICLTMLGLTAAPVVLAEASLKKHVVTGGGIAEYPENVVTLQYGFTAQRVDEQSHAKGEFVMQWHDMGMILMGHICYLWVFDNEALLGGYATQSNITNLPVGDGFIVRIQDNGEGSKATALDKISFLGFADPATIDNPYSVMLSKNLNGVWISGNIQVK